MIYRHFTTKTKDLKLRKEKSSDPSEWIVKMTCVIGRAFKAVNYGKLFEYVKNSQNKVMMCISSFLLSTVKLNLLTMSDYKIIQDL